MSCSRVARVVSVVVLLPLAVAAGEIPQRCPGDCNGDGNVGIGELVVAVSISLERSAASCDAADVDGNGSVSISELIAAVSAALKGCFAVQPSPTPTVVAAELPVLVESRDRIVSEAGEFELIEGTLSIERISLVAVADEVALLGPVTLDLGRDDNVATPNGAIPEREYSGFAARFAAPGVQTHVVELHLRHLQSGAEIRVVSDLEIEVRADFPQGPRLLSGASDLALAVRLTGALFYMDPLRDVVEGVYVVGENDRGFFSMNLGAMLELRDR